MGELRSAVDALAAVDPDTLDPAQLGALLVEAVQQRDRMSALCARLTAAHDRLLAWNADGARSQKDWLTDRCRLTPGAAGRQSRDARHLAELPRTAEAFAQGAITAAQATTAAAAVRDLPADALAGLDELVAEQAPELDPGRLRGVVDGYVHQAEPDGLADREQRAHRQRRLTISRTASGGVVGEFRLDPLAGETLLTAVAAHAAPAAADDSRTPEQRRADALVTLARLALDGGNTPMVGGVRPHVTVVVEAATLQQHPGAPPALLDRLGALSGAAARQLTCDPALTRVVTAAATASQPLPDPGFIRVVAAGASQPLDVGRASRVVTVAQRRALAVRDQGCVGCSAPVAWCEAHHIKHWVDGGPTDLANLILVCWRCHRDLHHAGKTPTRGPHGRWTLQRRDHDPP